MSEIVPRDYQLDAIERVRQSIRDGSRRVMLVSPTGSGKTICSCQIIDRALSFGSKVLFNAHRREIIDQTYDKLVRFGVPENQLGVIMAGDRKRRNPVAPVQIASIDTIRNRENKPPADLVFVDEAHRSLAKSIVRLMEAYPNAIIIGMTATPWRADNRGFDMVFDDMVVVATVQELIEKGYLAEPRVFIGERGLDLSGVSTKGGDYDEQELAAAVDKNELVGDIVKHWKEMSNGRKTVCFAVNVAHSKHIVEQFVAAGVRAEHLDGTMATKEREEILGRFVDGDTEVLSNVNVLAEGWDYPPCKCLIQARPTKSITLHLQQAGRILRPWEDVTPIILDHARNALSFGLPQDDREYTLEAPSKKKRAGASTVPIKTCPPPCYAVLSARVRVCPTCGHVFQPEEPIPDTVEGRMVEYTLEHRRRVWEELCAKEQEAGGPPGWAFQMYRHKFKANVPREFRPLSVPEHSERDKQSYARWLAHRARNEARSMRWVYALYRAKFNEDPPLEIVRADERREVAEGQNSAEKKRVEWAI